MEVNFIGDWNSGTAYNEGDFVVYDNIMYIALEFVVANELPPNVNNSWELVVYGGQYGPLTPTPTPTNTPTPSPVYLFTIQNTNTTRSVTSVTFNGVTQSLTSGSYPVLNASAFSTTILGCSGAGGDVMQINFGGTGFCGPNSKILKNGVDTGFPLAGYANPTFTLGGFAISTSDKIDIIID